MRCGLMFDVSSVEYGGICSMLSLYADGGNVRFHMPGHGGVGTDDISDVICKYDVTENGRTDNLYDPSKGGYVDKTLEMIERTYNSRSSVISAHGATAAVQASIYCCRVIKGDKFYVHRKCHASVINALILCDADISYFVNEYDLRELLLRSPGATVVLTSPDYYGALENVSAYSLICKQYDSLLVVDNSHGAHLLWCGENMHPLKLGADMCIDSMHKTTPALTGGALLHSTCCDRGLMLKGIRLFTSTSPSYIIAASVEKSVLLMRSCGADLLRKTDLTIKQFCVEAEKLGFCRYTGELYDPCRLTLASRRINGRFYDMLRLCEYLTSIGIVPEFASKDRCVFIVPVFTQSEAFDALLEGLRNFVAVSQPELLSAECVCFPCAERAMMPKSALFSASESVPVEKATGRISAGIKYVYPPGIPIVLPGDMIDERVASVLSENNINDIEVVINEEY